LKRAERLGVSQPYLAMLENGKRHLTPALARKVVAAYGLPPTELPVPAAFTPTEKVEGQRLAESVLTIS
jgi:transcriptional regulator with XRE-family HTH domain